jgi:hypothetical protein
MSYGDASKQADSAVGILRANLVTVFFQLDLSGKSLA